MRRVWFALVVLTLGLSSGLEPSSFAQDGRAQDRRGPFTADPRSLRSRDVDQQHIRIEMKVDLDKESFEGRVLHRLTPYQPLDTLRFDAAGMTIKRVTLGEPSGGPPPVEVKFEHRNDTLSVPLGAVRKPGEPLTVTVEYSVKSPEFGAHFVARNKELPHGAPMMWTQSEPDYARFWYPCIDYPSDRLTSETVITAAGENFVLSNGALKSKIENPDGTKTWHWVQEKSHVPYLLSVVVGDFEAYEQSWDGIPVVSYVPRGRLADARYSFEKTARMMEFFSRKIGYRYPWPKYAQICVDEYSWGGMEHTSATTLNLNTLHDERAHLDVSSDNLVAHELAHQWWGDVVTCKDWAELWLNESFATYFATLWTEQDEGRDEATWERRGEANSYFSQDKSVRRAIVNYRYNTPMVMFDSHSYPKGARVLHMLRFELGDELFWRALNRYIQVNQFRTVETADLRTAIEEATGQGLNWFFDQWIDHGGHPEFEIDWEWDEPTKDVRVTIKQTQKIDDVTPLFRTSAEIELALPRGLQLRRVKLTKAEETFHFQVDQRPSRVTFDPHDWILKKVKFNKSKDELLDQLANDTHLSCRLDALTALAELPRDAAIRAALTKAAKSDAFWGVRQEAIQALAKENNPEVRPVLLEAARKDSRSHVRRAALVGLGAFPHDDTKRVLREAIRSDRSYYAIADALRTLVRVDRQGCEPDLLLALAMPSHQHVILQAACAGLTEIKSQTAATQLTERLGQKLPEDERVQILSALTRLRPNDNKLLEALREQLASERTNVRRAAIEAIVAVGGPQAADWLREQRGKEHHQRMIDLVDQSIERLGNKERDVDQLRRELDELRRLNRQLEDRLKKLEGTRAPQPSGS